MLVDLIVLLFLIFMSAFFSSTELAFVVANKIKIELRSRKKDYSAQITNYFIENPNIFFSTILISNNIINIAFASLSTIFLTEYFGFTEFPILFVSTLILLMFGELIPKYLARENADAYVYRVAIPLRFFSFIFYPFVKIISRISSIIIDRENINEETAVKLFNKEEFESLIEESLDAGHVDEEQSDIIKKIIDLGDQKIYEAMTPRTEIVGLDINNSISQVIKTFIDSGYSKIPIFQENLDNIVGIVYAYDLFQQPENLKNIIRDINFVPETKKSLEMLNEFSNKGYSIAVVVDEFGGTAGLITVEDIVEEMLGEINDEYDIDEDICREISEDTYLISGKVEIDTINEKFEFKLEEGEYETIAGYITFVLGRIPEQGEQIVLGDFVAEIIRSDNTRIDLVKLYTVSSKNI